MQAFLAGDGSGHGLAKFHQVGLHVSHRLVEDLARILRLADEVVEVGAQQAAKPIKKAHGWWGTPLEAKRDQAKALQTAAAGLPHRFAAPEADNGQGRGSMAAGFQAGPLDGSRQA